MTNARMDLGALVGGAYKALARLDGHVSGSDLPKPLLELVRLRASQINGCAYCVDTHSSDARKGGESEARINAVAVWAEAPCFTERERAALALTESATRLSEGGDRVPDAVWERAAAQFSQQDLADLLVAIAAINAWNRLGVATRMVPESFAG
jgi:AhpD family alkylhydroperoxidase